MIDLKTMDLKKLKHRKTFPLHLHWDGSLPAKHLFNLAKEKGRELLLPEEDISGCRIEYKSGEERIIRSAEELEDFMHNLRRYQLVDVFNIPISFMQTKKDLLSAAMLLCQYLKEQNSPYAETRFAPQYHISAGLQLEEIIGTAVEGFRLGKEKTGVDVRLIISIGREADPNAGLRIAEAAIRCHKSYPNEVLGIDLACEEKNNPPEKHYPAFKATFGASLKRTVHAGEMCDEETNTKNIKTAIYKLRADALSHALPLHKNPDLIKEVLKRNIRIESNPICNQFFFNKDIHKDLRLDKLVEQGVLVTINPDDPALVPNGHMINNLKAVAELYGPDFVDKVIKNSIIASWGLSQEQKENYLYRLGNHPENGKSS